MAQRLVLVDDTNSNIQYSGPWFAAQNTQLDTGNFGPPFQNTLHGVNVDASFSYSFSGSSVTVFGTSITTNASGTQDPTWECFVDNHSIGWKTVLQYAENNWAFCQNGQLQDGPHVLSVKAKVSTQQTFWFDQIQYLPSSNVPLDQSILRIDSSDSAMQYSSGWKELDGIVNMTQTAGSTVAYEFSGVSLSWVGFRPGNFPLTSSSATYSIDGQNPVKFLVPTGAKELYNQVLFQTGQLSAGQHKLVVTHQGNSGTAPLALDYFVVQNAPSSPNSNVPAPSPSSSSTSSATSANSTTTSTVPLSSHIPTGVPTSVLGTTSIIFSNVPSSSSSNSTSNLGSTGSSTTTKSPLGAIIGGVLGGLVLVLLLLILFLFIRRRSNRGGQRLSEKLHPSHNTVAPFTVPPFHPMSTTSHSPQIINNKFAQSRWQPTDNPTTLNSMRSTSPPTDASGSVSGGGMPALTPLRNYSPSPAIASLSSSSGLVDGAITKAREAETLHLMQRSVSSQGGDTSFLRHEDSGIRMPPAQGNLVELPPLYTPG